MSNIAIFASGSGTNAEEIIRYFSTKNNAKVSLILTNKREAYVLKRAAKHRIPSVFFDQQDFYQNTTVLDILSEHKIDLIVLAGFLWLVPENILNAFNKRIINIHPALLPSYGGKGMYGEKVHKTVIENGEKESGITIHYVNQYYDSGDIIFQARCKVEKDDTAETLAGKIHALEYEHYPRIIDEVISSLPPVS
jgi:phosphoribosylglycinamide formyltransferase-1